MEFNSTSVCSSDSDYSAEEQELVPSEFDVRDDCAANWVVRKIVEARAYAKLCSEWCDRELARARRDEEFLLFRFGPQLVEHARKKIAEQGGRRKSANLPAGAIGFRRQSSKLIVDDESAVLDWARKSQPDLIVVSERLSKTALNEHFEATGELPDAGVHVEPARESFYIK